jgi:hypothetical protein
MSTRKVTAVSLALLVVIATKDWQPTMALAQIPTLPGQQPEPASGVHEPSAMMFVDQPTMEQLLARLEAAEAEIQAIRQLPGITGTLAAVPPPSVPQPANDSVEHAASADRAKSANILIPLSTECGDITFKPGLRIQPRYQFDDANDDNDFFIRRFRLKGGGSIFDYAWYGAEFKIDSSERFGSALHPDAIVENAWVDVTVWPESTFLRVGLYDVPFSRNALTSDSKLLFMDRSLIKEYLTVFGLTDNTVGAMLHGRPYGGRYEWYVGAFDNIEFEFHSNDTTRQSDQLMPAGRFVVNLLDPAEPPQGYADYQESYLGKGERLQLGVNAASLNDAFDNGLSSDVVAWGADVFYNIGPWVAMGELDWFEQDFLGAANVQGEGLYLQAGYLIDCRWELAARYQLLDPDTNTAGDQLRWTSIGLNYYFWEHNLKVQTDYTFKDEQGLELANNMFEVQLQLDY